MQRVQVTLIDDLDGKSAAEETISYTFDGVSYEIDLSRTNAARFRDAMSVWMEASRVSEDEEATEDDVTPAKVRAWALSQGHQVSDRGRLPKGLIRDYLDAQRAAS